MLTRQAGNPQIEALERRCHVKLRNNRSRVTGRFAQIIETVAIFNGKSKVNRRRSGSIYRLMSRVSKPGRRQPTVSCSFETFIYVSTICSF